MTFSLYAICTNDGFFSINKTRLFVWTIVFFQVWWDFREFWKHFQNIWNYLSEGSSCAPNFVHLRDASSIPDKSGLGQHRLCLLRYARPLGRCGRRNFRFLREDTSSFRGGESGRLFLRNFFRGVNYLRYNNSIRGRFIARGSSPIQLLREAFCTITSSQKIWRFRGFWLTFSIIYLFSCEIVGKIPFTREIKVSKVKLSRNKSIDIYCKVTN